MEESKDISALISLLDDSDKEVYQHVFDKLASFGPEIIPTLETAWGETFNPTLHERIEELIHSIQFHVLTEDIKLWRDTDHSLFEGALLVARYQFPEIDVVNIKQQLEKLKQEIWLELNYNLTPIEQINVFNQVFYSLNGFSGNISNSQDPRYHCLNYVVETKKGNSISLGILYLVVAAMLGIPVFGVRLPRHFVLCYSKNPEPNFADPQLIKKDVLFYINPLNKGFIFTRNEIKEYLKKSHLDPKPEHFIPSSNVMIINELINNLVDLYRNSGNLDKARELSNLLTLLSD